MHTRYSKTPVKLTKHLIKKGDSILKKTIGLLLAMGIVVSATACSPGTQANTTTEEMEQAENNSRVLIAYFSRWRNTDFADDVDATISASIVADSAGRYHGWRIPSAIPCGSGGYGLLTYGDGTVANTSRQSRFPLKTELLWPSGQETAVSYPSDP